MLLTPTILRKYVVNWYHTYLLHPSKLCTEATISQHYYWNQLREDICTYIKFCTICQKNKKKTLKYGKLPAKEVEAIPREILLVDIIGPYKIRREGNDKPLILNALTMIDLATGWFEIVSYNDKQAATISNIVEQTWLFR